MDFLYNVESVSIILPQFLMLATVYKFVKNRGIIIMSDGNRRAPAIISIEETISTEWRLAD